jgi:hypothetical protein
MTNRAETQLPKADMHYTYKKKVVAYLYSFITLLFLSKLLIIIPDNPHYIIDTYPINSDK